MDIEISTENDRIIGSVFIIFSGKLIDFSEEILDLSQFDITAFAGEKKMSSCYAEKII